MRFFGFFCLVAKALNRKFRGLHSVFFFASFGSFIEPEAAKKNTRESQREVHAKGEREERRRFLRVKIYQINLIAFYPPTRQKSLKSKKRKLPVRNDARKKGTKKINHKIWQPEEHMGKFCGSRDADTVQTQPKTD